MKNIRTICLSLLIATGAAAVGGESFRKDINPALRYYQAFLVAPDLSQPDRDYLFTNEWRGQNLPERFGDLIARYDKQFKLVRQAGEAVVPCDWGIDMTPGPATLLPQLARNKAIAQAAKLRALWDVQHGKEAEARDDLLGAFALARNSSRDGTLIAALVQIAMETIVCNTVAENFHRFSPETLKELIAGFDAAPARGTVSACMASEESFFVDWLVSKVVQLQNENLGNDAKVMAGIRELVVETLGPEEGQNLSRLIGARESRIWDQVTKAAGGTSEGVLKLLRDMKPQYEKAAVILALPRAQYEEQMRQFKAEIDRSANPFMAQMFPSVEKCRQKEFAVVVTLAMVRAAVEYKLHGQEGLQRVTDPCGQGPFAFERFNFQGVDRGFKLTSAFDGRGFPEVLIFVEKDGPPFHVNWQHAGEAIAKTSSTK
jgi:hypothetical protein